MRNKLKTPHTIGELPANARSPCPIACALDILGDKWTLLIIRDLFLGKRRFKEFLESPEGITPNILTERLRRLEKASAIIRHRYSEHPPRDEYLLTTKGAELSPTVLALLEWSLAHIPGTKQMKPLREPAIIDNGGGLRYPG